MLIQVSYGGGGGFAIYAHRDDPPRFRDLSSDTLVGQKCDPFFPKYPRCEAGLNCGYLIPPNGNG